MPFESILTPRLKIRRFQMSDLDRLLEYRNDPETALMQGWTTPFMPIDAKAFILSVERDEPGTPGHWFQFAIADETTDFLLGDVGLFTGNRHARSRLGYTIHPDSRGQGYAGEAAEAVARFAHTDLQIAELVADTLDSNLGSLRVLHRLGFAGTDVARVVDDGSASYELDYVLRLHDPSRLPTVIGILVGGQSTRMGADKATTTVDGQTMAERVAAACRATGLPTVVLGPTDAGTGLPSVPDRPDNPATAPKRGPLAGLAAALAHSPGSNVILVATDQPFVRSTTLMQLALQPDADVVVPLDQGHPQVTLARYGPGVSERIAQRDTTRLRDLLDAGSVRRVEEETWRRWGEDGRSFRSLDHPRDIAQAIADYSASTDLPSAGD